MPSSPAHLRATYTSPTNAPLDLSTELPIPHPSSSSTAAESVRDKTSYLRSLRQATSAMQERLNAELTARMDEDNRRSSDAGDKTPQQHQQHQQQHQQQGGGARNGNKRNSKKRKQGVDEAAEEENYGEEMQEDDA